jgi:hypothetical protein
MFGLSAEPERVPFVPSGMIRTALATAAASALVFHLGGCQRGPAMPSPDAA